MKDVSESQFYFADLATLQVPDLFTLDAEESHHALKVFRHRVGDLLMVTNGLGLQGVAELQGGNAQAAQLQLREIQTPVPAPRLHLAIAALKDGDLEDVLEHCAQMNLGSLTILRTAHSQEPRDSNLTKTVRRLEMKSLAALKQSRKAWLTQIYGPIYLDDWLARTTSSLVLCTLGSDAQLSENLRHSVTDMVILVGPEGGFSLSEEQSFLERGAEILTLGNTRLRARTCPMIALGALVAQGFI